MRSHARGRGHARAPGPRGALAGVRVLAGAAAKGAKKDARSSLASKLFAAAKKEGHDLSATRAEASGSSPSPVKKGFSLRNTVNAAREMRQGSPVEHAGRYPRAHGMPTRHWPLSNISCTL